MDIKDIEGSSEEDKKIVDAREELDQIENHPLVAGSGVHVCSDGTEVNWKTTVKNIRIKMMHLEGEEIDKVIAMGNEYRVLMGRRNVCNRILSGESFFKKNHHWELAMKRSQEILDLFGKMYSGQEVHRIITTEWELPNVKYDFVLKFQRENLDTIATLKNEYQKDISSVRLIHKKSRLEELSELYQGRRVKYSETESRADYDLLLKTIEQIRRESEGQVLTINGQIKIEHEVAIQDHITSEIMKHININDLIISRLCSRIGVNPKLILYRLHNSYYKKFTGFLPSEKGNRKEIIYPSQIVYDFNRIKELSNEVAIQDAEYIEEDKLESPEESSNLKNLLVKKIQERKREIDSQNTHIKNTYGK